MKVLFCGDISGKSGRDVISKNLLPLKERYKIDFVIANGDNVAGGFGIDKASMKELLDMGINVVTGGDHIWDKKEASELLNIQPRLLRPHNFPPNNPGTGARVFNTRQDKKVLVIHLMGQVFMKFDVECPFAAVDDLLNYYQLKKNVDAIIIDFHAEATSEKVAFGKYVDGRVSAVLGTHTHIPTADYVIFKKGTAYQTDCGMCGDYDSVIGVKEDVPIKNYLHKRKMGNMEAAKGPGTMYCTIVELDDNTGLAKTIDMIGVN